MTKKKLCSDLLSTLAGKTLATAESCTGGGIGQALTAIPGSSKVYKGGIICYVNQIKRDLLHVPASLLETEGAVSASVAEAMACADGSGAVVQEHHFCGTRSQVREKAIQAALALALARSGG